MEVNLRSARQAEENTIVEQWGQLMWLADAGRNGCEGLTLGRVIIRAGQSNPRHSHNNCDEVLYLMSGRLEHSFADETVTMEPGDTLFVPAGVFHNAVSVGDVDADMIVAYSSGRRGFQPENK